MLYVYIGCLTFGVVYSLISALLGGAHGFGHGGFDHGGFDHGGLDHAGVDASGTDASGLDSADVNHAGAAGHAYDNAASPSPFNPLVIAGAITAFGAVGLISKAGLGMGDFLSTVVSLGFAGAVGALLFFGVVKLVYSSQSNSVFSLEDLVGTEAEVITPVPAKGMGEVAYVINGIRYNMTARSCDGEIQRGSTVIIRSIAGNAAMVQKKLTIDDVEILEEELQKSRENEKN